MTVTALSESFWTADTSEALLETTLGGLLREAASDVPDRVALVEGVADRDARRRWTYAELLAEAERVARGLLRVFTPGEAVAIYSANRPEWLFLQHGMSLAGLRVVALNPAYKAEEAEVIVRSSDAVGLFVDDAFAGNDIPAIARGIAERVPELRTVVAMSALELFAAAGDPAAPLPDVSPDDLLHIQYTSGTTGVPKGALLHHRGVVNTSRYVALRAGFPEGGVWINAMPMFHIGGSAVTSMGCLAQKGTYVLAPGFDPGGMLELIESEGGMASLVVPTMILALLDHPDFATRDLSSMVTVLSGAAAVPAALVARVKREIGCGMTILFGQTELNGVVCQTRLTDSTADQAETLGQPLPHADVKIADPVDGRVKPIGEEGEICVRGYQNMAGYHGEPQATAQTLRSDGWLHTGDLGVMDERGFVRIAGRLKDMIIRGGMNLSPREIEDVIFDHEQVAQVSVIGVPDERWGEVIGAVVVPRDPAAPPDPSELNAYCRERLATHKSPRYWYFADGFPLTPSGKIQKFRLAEQIGAGDLVAHPWAPE